jgi:hypothetical protein
MLKSDETDVHNALLEREKFHTQLDDESLADDNSSEDYADVRSSRVRYSDGSLSGQMMTEKGKQPYVFLISDEEKTLASTKRDKLTRYGIYLFFSTSLGLVLYIAFAAIYHSYIYTQYNAADYVYNYNPVLGSEGAKPTGVIFTTSRAAGLGTTTNPIVVTLVGDSMIAKAYAERNLGGKLVERLSKETDLQFKFINRGNNGATIQNIGNVIVPRVIEDGSSIVILNWDSDATDSDTYGMTPEQYSQFKTNYEQQLNWCIANVTNLEQVKYFAIAGPSLFGEGPVFKPSRFTPDKDQVLIDLRAINIGVAQHFNIPYIDMNHALHSVSVPWWGLYRFWCTQDGEHYSELGASIESDNFVRFLTF